MKASTEKTATSTSTTATQTPQEPFFSKKGGEGFFENAPQGNAPFIQAKLTVNQPGDIYEQEADRVADQVVQRLAMPSPEPASPLLSTAGKSPAPIQTKCADCEQEEKLQRKEEEVPEEREEIQRKEESASPSSPGDEAGSDFSTRLQSSKGGGAPLPENTRTDMESALGTDLSSVRIHTGGEAAGMSKDINAQAFTHGSDVYFNDGKFDAGSSDGKRLLAHELVHVGQQGGDQPQSLIQAKHGDIIFISNDNGNITGWQVEVDITTDIEAGDPDRELLFEFIKAQYKGILEGNASKGASLWGWKNPPSAKKKGSVSRISMNNEKFMGGLYLIYANSNNAALKEYRRHFSVSLTTFSEEQQSLLHIGAQHLSFLSSIDYAYFDKWVKSDTKSVDLELKSGIIEDQTLDTLPFFIEGLVNYGKGQLENLAEANQIEPYAEALPGDCEKTTELNTLIDSIDTINPALIKKYTDITSKGWVKNAFKKYLEFTAIDINTKTGKITLPILFPFFTGLLVTVTTDDPDIVKFVNLEKDLASQGHTLEEFIRFMEVFQQMAISKAFKMLDENQQMVGAEKDRYSDLDGEGFSEFYNYIVKGYSKDIRDANIVRTKAIQDFFIKEWDEAEGLLKKIMDIYLASLASGLLKDLYGRRNNWRHLLQIVEENSPHGIVEALAELIKIREYYNGSADRGSFSPERFAIIGSIYNDKADMVLSEYPAFKEAFNQDLKTSKNIHSEGASIFPILFDFSFDFRGMIIKSNSKNKDIAKREFHKSLLNEIDKKIENNETVKKEMSSDPELVWKLEGVIDMIKNEYAISNETPSGMLIEDVLQDVRDNEFWMSIGIGALGLVLGIAGFFTAGSTWVALGLIGAGASLTLIDLYIETKKYIFQSAAADTAFNPAYELSKENPSILAIVMDVFALLLLPVEFLTWFKSAAKAAKAMPEATTIIETGLGKMEASVFRNALQDSFSKIYSKVDDEVALREEIGKLYDLLGKTNVKGQLSKADFINETVNVVKKDKEIKSTVLNILKIHGIDPDSINAVSLVGLQRMHRTDPETADFFIRVMMKNHPRQADQLLLETVTDDTFGTVLGKIRSMPALAESHVEDTFKFLGSIRQRRLYDTLGQTVDSLSILKAADPEMISQILKNKRLHSYVISLPDLEDITKLWSTWKTSPKGQTFAKFVDDTEKLRLDKIQKIGDDLPINAQNYAGRTFYFDLERNQVKLNRLAKDYKVKPPTISQLREASKTNPKLSKTINELDALTKKYPNGFKFDEKGFPKFDDIIYKKNITVDSKTIEIKAEVDIGKLRPDTDTQYGSALDMIEADKKMKLEIPNWRKPADYTWHHVENSTKLQLIPSDVHETIRHTGGRATGGLLEN